MIVVYYIVVVVILITVVISERVWGGVEGVFVIVGVKVTMIMVVSVGVMVTDTAVIQSAINHM